MPDSQKGELSELFYLLTQEIEQKLNNFITGFFTSHNQSENAAVVFTCLKELMNNAAKANIKRVLFTKNGIDINNEEAYLKAMIGFKELLITNNYHVYEVDLRQKNYWIQVKLSYTDHHLFITVENNVVATPIEDRRLREKLKKAMSYTDIAQFYMEQGDEMEGAGMGIALIIMLLKGLHVNPELFTIDYDAAGKTIAKMEVPIK